MSLHEWLIILKFTNVHIYCIYTHTSSWHEKCQSWVQASTTNLQELARLLQDQDGKRRGDLLHQDQLMAIEAQDRELAKVLQEQVSTTSDEWNASLVWMRRVFIGLLC